MKTLQFIFRLIVCQIRPLIKNTVFFDSFHGQYNDNPKYISEQLHEMDHNIEIVWCVSEKGKDLPPSYARCVKYDSPEYYYYAFNSSVVVDNNVGIKTLGFKKIDIPILHSLLKKRGQLCISTWHGTPLKKIGRDQIKRKSSVYYTSTDFCVSGCEYHTKWFSQAFYINSESVKMYGMPRNDILFTNINKEALRKKLGLPIEKGIVLFAPTFRDSLEDSGITQVRQLDIKKLLCLLEIKFHKEFVFVLRVHHTVLKEIEKCNILSELSDVIIDGNAHDDMAEYLFVSDVLITDYSGSMIDYALTGKPCFLLAHDFNRYKDIERGLYVDYYGLPFSKAFEYTQLYSNIEGYDEKEYKKKINDYLLEIGNCESGTASYKVTKEIIKHIYSHNS